MKPIVFMGFLLGIGIGFAQAQRLKPVSTRAPTITLHERSERGIASITFLTVANDAPVQSAGLDHGILNLGVLSNSMRPNENGAQIQSQRDSFVVATRVGLRIDLSNSSNTGTVTVSAYLLSPDPLRTVWLDGVQLSMRPEIIARHVFYGAITEHVLKIVVPASMPPGQFVDLIGVLVTPN
jgi:hypothetical protein